MERIRVLYAEDDELTRLEVREKMEAKGWEVIEARDGIEAIEMYKRCGPDVIILDVDMPRRTGLEVLQLIRVNDLLTPVVIYSSLAKEEDLMAGLACGAEVYIIKDYSVTILLMQIEKLLHKRSAEEIELTEGVFYDFATTRLKIGNRTQKLSMLESKVFAILCKNKNKLSQRELLLQAGWNSNEPNIEAQLNKVMSKFKQLLKDAEGVEIVLDKGNGYWLKEREKR